MKKILSLTVLTFMTISLFASEAATKEECLKLAGELLSVTRQENQLKSGFQTMRDMQKQMIPQMLAAKGIKLNTEQKEKQQQLGNLIMRAVEEEMSWDKMRPIMLKAFAETFTAEEMKELIKFFNSPVGQTYLEKTPLVQKAMLSSVQGLAFSLQKRLDAEIEKFLAAEKTTETAK